MSFNQLCQQDFSIVNNLLWDLSDKEKIMINQIENHRVVIGKGKVNNSTSNVLQEPPDEYRIRQS